MPSSALGQILYANRAPRVHDGRPLWAYQVTEEELTALREALQRRFSLSHDLRGGDAAAFCLFAAHWFCLHHDGGAWSWDTVLQPVGYPGHLPQIYAIVADGLRVWRRGLLHLNDRTRWLFTLACEGGLPLGLLRQETSRLKRYVRRILEGREAYPDVSARELAERWQQDLPAGLRNRPVFVLVGDLVERVCALRQILHRRAEESDPIARLDREHPPWRSELPLRIGDATAKALLLGLLRLPRAVAERVERPAVTAMTQLQMDGGRARLVRSVTVSPEVSASRLKQQLGVELPSRFRLVVQTSGGERLPLAMASRVHDRYVLAPYGQISRWDDCARGSLDLIACHGSDTVGQGLIPGAEALDDLPWVFTATDERLEWIGSGSVQAREPCLVVALRDGALESTDFEVIGELNTGEAVRKLVKIRSPLRVIHEGDCLTIEPGVERAESGMLALCGRRADLGPTGDEAWLGLPTAVVESESGFQGESGLLVEWRAVGGGAWARTSTGGDGHLRVVRRGRVVMRRQAKVVPAHTRVEFQPGPGSEEGKLRVVGLACRSVQATLPGGESRVARQGDSLEVQCKLPAEAPAQPVLLDLLLATGDRLTLRVGCPAPRFQFTLAGGTPLRSGTLVTVELLSGIRAQALTLRSRPVDLSARLRSEGRAARELTLGRLRDTTGNGVLELPLDPFQDDIEAMLAAARELDARVEVLLREGDDPRPRATLVVQHYDATFAPRARASERSGSGTFPALSEEDPPGETLVLSEESRSAVDFDPARLRVEARPVWQPLAEPVLLHGDGGSWRFDPREREAGAWLITGWIGEQARVRPSVIPIEGEPACQGSKLLSAIHTRASRDRLPKLEGLVRELARDANHPDWPRVQEHLIAVQRLPAGTFDLIRALVVVPDAMALATLMYGSELEASTPALQRLPFAWAAVPLGSWRRAAMAYRTALGEMTRYSAHSAGSLLQWLRWHLPSPACVALVLQRTLGALESAPEPILQEAQMLEALCGRTDAARAIHQELERRLADWGQHLMRAHAHDSSSNGGWWPVEDVPALIEKLHIPEWARRAFARLRTLNELPDRQSAFDAPLAAAILVSADRFSGDTWARLRRVGARDESYFHESLGNYLNLLVPDALRALELESSA